MTLLIFVMTENLTGFGALYIIFAEGDNNELIRQ